jgi:hypothetical protein
MRTGREADGRRSVGGSRTLIAGGGGMITIAGTPTTHARRGAALTVGQAYSVTATDDRTGIRQRGSAKVIQGARMMEGLGLPEWARWPSLVLLIIVVEGCMALYMTRRRRHRQLTVARQREAMQRTGTAP